VPFAINNTGRRGSVATSASSSEREVIQVPHTETLQELGYDYKQLEPVLEVLVPGTDWVVRNHKGSAVWISKGIPSLDIDEKDPSSVARVVSTLSEQGAKFRLYETCNGLRVLLPGVSIAPVDFEWERLSGLAVDPLYKNLALERNAWKSRISTKVDRSGGKTFSFSEDRPYGIARLVFTNMDPDVELDSPIQHHDRNVGAHGFFETLA